jgi:mevalonate kinase
MMIKVESQIPPGAGLSSSAAVTLASLAGVAAYMGTPLSVAEVCALAYEVEAKDLATGAGQMDFYSCALGGIVYLNCSEVPPDPLERFRLDRQLRLLIGDTRTSRSTKASISRKRERWERGESDIHKYFALTVRAVDEIRTILANAPEDLSSLGNVVSLCHGYLRDYLKVSTHVIDTAVDLCRASGAVGAKLTGAGLGGCFFALMPSTTPEGLRRALHSLGVRALDVPIDYLGLTIAIEHANERQASSATQGSASQGGIG